MKAQMVALSLFLSARALAADFKESDAKAEEKNKVEELKNINDYRHELTLWANYTKASGATKSEQSTEETTAQQTLIDASFSYGLLLGDYAEPFVEMHYASRQESIVTYSSKQTELDWGGGVLFNIPIAKQSVKNLRTNPNLNAPVFSNSTVVPYGGIIMSSKTLTGQSGAEASLNSSSGDLATKIICGLRILPAPHMAMHFYGRFSYHTSRTSAETPTTEGSTTRGTTIEAHMFAISLLL